MSWRVAIGGLPDSLRNPTVCHSESVSVAACCRCVPPPPRPSEPHTPSLAAHHSRSLCTSSKLPTPAWATRMSWWMTSGGLTDPLRPPTVCHRVCGRMLSLCATTTTTTTTILKPAHLLLLRSLCTPHPRLLGQPGSAGGCRWWAAPPSTPPYHVPPCLWPSVGTVCHHHHDHLRASHAFSFCLILTAVHIRLLPPHTPAWASWMACVWPVVGCPTLYVVLPCPTVSVGACCRCVPPPPLPFWGPYAPSPSA